MVLEAQTMSSVATPVARYDDPILRRCRVPFFARIQLTAPLPHSGFVNPWRPDACSYTSLSDRKG